MQSDLISARAAHILMPSGGSGKKVYMVKIQSFHADKPYALDRVVEEWLAQQPQKVKIISFCKYCANDGRRHFCSIMYEVRQTNTEASSPSKK